MTPSTDNTAIVPVPKIEEDFYDWYERHEAKCRAAAARSHDLVFIGDSITHLFEGDPGIPGRGERIWREFYGPRRVLNLGFGWDRTQNVLWRLAHGELLGQTPRVAVVLIGTNNLTGTARARTNTPAEIVEGIQAVCRSVLSVSPATRILLLGIFPRSTPADPLRERVREVNGMLAATVKGQSALCWEDIGNRFMLPDGTISPEIMNDGVHLTEKGYRIWAEAIEPILAPLLG